MRKIAVGAAGGLFALALSLLALAFALQTVGCTPGLLSAVMVRQAPEEATGLPAGEYGGVCRLIAGYLSGREDVFQYRFERGGTAYLCFGEREQAHMRDVRALFELDRAVLTLALALSLLLLLFSLPRASRMAFARGAQAGAGLVLLVCLALAAACLADFDGVFVLFHRLAFDNDLWLLNPATDLLIRLMPLGFFVVLAAVALGIFLPVPAAILVLARRARRHAEARHA